MKPVVFIHTNDFQMLGAKLSKHSLERGSRHADRFEVRYLRYEEQPQLTGRVGQNYLRRRGKWVTWNDGNPQSFTPLRFLPPQAMGFQGRALVIDPDVFAVGDVWPLLDRDMAGKALMCRRVEKPGTRPFLASSVMLLDCEKLRHWRWDEQIEEMFQGRRPYRPWINLELEPEENIGTFEARWNDLDHLDDSTVLLHFTRRLTQPWKTGLPLGAVEEGKTASKGRTWIDRLLGREPKHRRNPDPRQERFFFELLADALEAGVVSGEELSREVSDRNVRPDVFEVLARYSPPPREAGVPIGSAPRSA